MIRPVTKNNGIYMYLYVLSIQLLPPYCLYVFGYSLERATVFETALPPSPSTNAKRQSTKRRIL